MKNRRTVPLIVLTVVVSMALCITVIEAEGGGGQTATPAAPAYSPARTPDGQPDIQGFWNPVGTFYNIQDLEFQSLYQNFASNPGQRGKSLIIDPPDGKIPFQPWAAEKVKLVLEHHADPTPQFLDPNARCFMQGVPRHLNNREFQIFQPPGNIVFLNMAHHTYRVVPLNAGPHISERIKLWMGDSRGRWDGNTLVVDVTNNNDQPWLDVVGTFHSDALRVAERLVPVNADTIDYFAIMTDPKVYTRPWTMKLTFRRIKDYGSELYEEACVEGNAPNLDAILKRPGR